MSAPSIEPLLAWSALLGLAAYLACGLALGLVQLGALWRSVGWMTGAARGVAIAPRMLGRFALLGGLLTLAALRGAPQLLAMALGVLVARSVVLRRVRGAVP